jgi:ribonuclease HI
MKSAETEIIVYTDGACVGNPGPGGWAAILVDRTEGGQERIVCDSEELITTNQRMEIQAAVEGLSAIDGSRRVRIVTDSAYLAGFITDRWWEKWERNRWRSSSKTPVANRDLWERLLIEIRRHSVTCQLVKGHSGDLMNERVNTLAEQAARKRHG